MAVVNWLLGDWVTVVNKLIGIQVAVVNRLVKVWVAVVNMLVKVRVADLRTPGGSWVKKREPFLHRESYRFYSP